MALKSPAFQWYPRDILASERVALMTLEEECVYRRMLDLAWLHEGIPADPQKCQILIGKNASISLIKRAQKMFTKSRKNPDRLVNDRMEQERAKQKKNRLARKKAANARWSKTKAKQSNRNADGYANALQMESSSSSYSPSSSTSTSDVGEKKENPAAKEMRGVIKGLKERMNTPNLLPESKRWMSVISNVIRNNYSDADFLKTYDLLEKIRAMKKAGWYITPEMIEKNIGRMESLAQEIRNLEGDKLPTPAEKENADKEFRRNNPPKKPSKELTI